MTAYPDFSLQLRLASRDVLSTFDGLSHLSVDRHPVRTTEHSAAAQESKGIVLSARVVNSNVPKHIFPDLLCQVNVNPEEVSCNIKISAQLATKGTRMTLTIGLGSLDLLKQTLEPTKRGGISADPEELDSAEGA